MKDITLQVALRPHLASWLRTKYGDPVRFPPRSYENLLLHSLVTRGRYASGAVSLQGPGKELQRITLTDHATRRPEYYHHLTRRAAQTFASAIERQFRLALWCECSPLLYRPTGLNRGIDAWCQRQGISVEYREGVRQKFYRMRKEYQKNCHDSGKK